MNAIQKMNAEMIALLSAIFQKRREPNFAWKSACSAFQALPGLRGFWPMSGYDSGGHATDFGNLAHHMQNVHNSLFDFDGLAPYCDFDGTNDYLYVADHADYDIIGNEIYITNPGVTIGGWFWADSLAGQVAFISKHLTGVSIAYELLWTLNTVRFYENTGFVAGANISTGTWHYLVGRFVPSTSRDLWIDGQKTTAATGAATLVNNAADLRIASEHGVAGAILNPLNGRASMCFVCAVALSDAIIQAKFHQTRAMYGV